MKKALCLVLALIMLASFLPATAYDTVTVKLNGRILSFDTPPQLINGTTMVPIRAIGENIGGKVKWTPEGQRIDIKLDETEIVLNIGSIKATVNGEEKTLLKAPYISHGRTMVPLRFISENMGCNVGWVQETQTVNITYSGIILNKITSEYPIIIIPGTMASLPVVTLDIISKLEKVETNDTTIKLIIASLIPMLTEAREKLDETRANLDPHHYVKIDDREYIIDLFSISYDYLHKYFNEHGLEYGRDYFIFGYDSLGSKIEDSAGELSEFVDYVIKKTGKSKVNLVGHSQGALVARAFAQTDDNYKKINIFMGVGGPYKGSAEAHRFMTISAFDIFNNSEILAAVFAEYGEYDEAAKTKYLDEKMRAVSDMLPIYSDKYSDVNNGFLKKLTKSSETARLRRLGAKNVINIVGTGLKTADEPSRFGYTTTIEGDGIVPEKSARLGAGFKDVLIKGCFHGNMFKEGSAVYDYFDLD